jgi:Protein of unknown function (DUF2914)
MKRFLLLAGLILALTVPEAVLAVEVSEAVLTTGIQDRMPVDQIEMLSAGSTTLYCFSRIVGAAEETKVQHVWFWGDKEMARVELPVRSINWRTWSSKRIAAGWSGDWRVEIQDQFGEVLTTLPFTVQ